MDTRAVSVVIPTVGRRDLLEACVRSVLACHPAAAEIVLVDQSHGSSVTELVESLADPSVRRVGCDGTGTARAMNRGLEMAAHDTVFVTHDDCTVAEDWIGVGSRLAAASPDAIITGRVLPPDGSRYVPSTKTDPQRRDYTGVVTSGVLYPANMIASIRAIRSLGGFDERTSLLVAEDNDLCYRWLAAGRPFHYEPDLVVWHHDWRTPEELVRTHVAYAKAQGGFYAKHLYARDPRVVRLLAWDLRRGLRTTVRGTLRREPRFEDAYREMLRWLPVGLVGGLREARRLGRDRRQPGPSATA
jgi:GT2 family glycosyltransferase